MSQGTVIAIVVVALAIIGLIAWMFSKRRRSHELKDRFGPEYNRLVHERGTRHRAEAELDRRTKRVERLSIRPLVSSERTRYVDLWQVQQARFVDDPRNAVTEADRLVEEVMKARGYPMGDFEQRAADISVDHPRVVENYRAAHQIAVGHKRGEANTEDLRKAMVHYRALFEELLEDSRPVEVHS